MAGLTLCVADSLEVAGVRGIGANTAVFSIVRGVTLQPLPYKDPGGLVDVLDASVKDPDLSHTFGTYADFMREMSW